MAPLPVYNRGFGGATTYDILYYLDKIVIPYAPRVIVFYCGTNDFGPESHDENGVFERTRKFFEIVRQKLPETKIVYISIVRCPFRKAYWSNMRGQLFFENQLIEESKLRDILAKEIKAASKESKDLTLVLM